MPGTTTGTFKFPVPSYSDAADGPKGFTDLGNAVDALLSQRFGTSSEISSDAAGLHLTGTRSGGGWLVPDGDIVVGRVDVAANRGIYVLNRSSNGKSVSVRFSADAGVLHCQGVYDGVEAASFILAQSGELDIYSGSPLVARPMPFAVATATPHISLSGQAMKSAVVNYPPNRFTVRPVVGATAFHYSGTVYAAIVGFADVSSVTVSNGLRDGNAVTIATDCHVTMHQMTPGAAAGLAQQRESVESLAPNGAASCQNSECPSYGIDVPGVYFEHTGMAWCADCDRECADVITTKARYQ